MYEFVLCTQRICPMWDGDKNFLFFSPPFPLHGKGPFRFLFSVKLSVCGGRHPKGSVKIETWLFFPKQLIHRKGNRPLLNFLSIRLTASRGHTRREKLPWITIIPPLVGEKEKGRKKEKKKKRANKFTREHVRSCVSIVLNVSHHWHPRFPF